MIQLDGSTGKPIMKIEEGSRIFSIKDTKIIMEKGLSARSNKDFLELGKEVIKMVEIQNKRKPEFTKE